MKTASIILAASMMTLVSCGNSEFYNAQKTTASQQTASTPTNNTDATYRVTLMPANPRAASGISGIGIVMVQGDQVSVQMTVSGASQSVQVQQHIHSGGACATMADDTNHDGFIDMNEAMARGGNVLVSLDSVIDSNGAGDTFPMTDTTGSYHYKQTGSLSRMLGNLTTNGSSPMNNLNLEGKVVELHGVPATTTLPSTVAAGPTGTAQANLPIACGVLHKDGATTTGGTAGGITGGTGGMTSGSTGTTTPGTGGMTTGSMGSQGTGGVNGGKGGDDTTSTGPLSGGSNGGMTTGGTVGGMTSGTNSGNTTGSMDHMTSGGTSGGTATDDFSGTTSGSTSASPAGHTSGGVNGGKG